MADTANRTDADFLEAPETKSWAKFVYAPEVTGTGWMTCKVDQCEETVRSKWGTLCNKHYFRGRRTGTAADRAEAKPYLTSHGYLAKFQKAHPANSSKKGLLYEHRRIFYEVHGPDGHHCSWCNVGPLVWGGAGAGKLHVDHRNGQKTDNAPDNLLPSCHRCNVNRGLFMAWISRHKDDPVLREMFANSNDPE